MKIVYLHQYFNTPTMHGGTRSYELARRLVGMGHEVHMVTSDTRPQAPSRGWRETNESGIQVHWLPVPYSNSMKNSDRIRAFSNFAVNSTRRAAQLSGDVFFATSTPLTIAVPGIFASRWNSRPMVFEVRDLWPAIPIAVGALKSRSAILAAQLLEKAAYAGAAHIVALSPGMKAGVEAAGVSSEKITIIPNLCDPERFQVPASAGKEFRAKYPWLQDRPMVLYAGTLGLVNGVGYLVRLAKEMLTRDPEVRFVIMGQGREEADLHALAERLGVKDHNLFFLPSVPKAQVPAVLSAATIATSLFTDVDGMQDNSANKFFDALAAGRPLALNYGGWQAELLDQEPFGLRLPPRDVPAAADMLAKKLRDPKWLAQAGALAGRLGKERYSADTAAVRLAEVLQRAAAAARS
ncbi:glycosyltransferase family 4 protein [Corallococcus sp. bb12-1]|uniref:glycosyltransferase family 4 protein n=1 Tax=Corallococcus sp. bb12-1 TaxID=2996784 RepID=UPI00226EDE67|nr:glycosyltransferase family 4 protein [Corallococcus sp. bb12-1]MCY1044679.1 glycosyltransferase family 4 protein [Corallococcus sp. bb12-1]